MANLSDTAAIIQDLYYQNFKTDEDFFNEQHFMYLAGVSYSKLLEDEYREARKEARLEEGFTDVVMQADWAVEKEIELKKDPKEEGLYVGELPVPVFSFPFDVNGYGLQYVRRGEGTKCSQFIRTSIRESWMDCQLPITKRAFFYAIGGKLNIQSPACPVAKVRVGIIPEISAAVFGQGGGPVPQSKEDTIIRKTLELMYAARQGVVVDMSNNSNPNKTMQTEVDSMFSNIKTKPHTV